jgi:hypothetical protein
MRKAIFENNQKNKYSRKGGTTTESDHVRICSDPNETLECINNQEAALENNRRKIQN